MKKRMMKIGDISKDTIKRLNAMSAEELIVWAFENFGERAAIGTSLQLTGTVILHMASRHFKTFRAFTIDTHRLYPETYDMIRKTEERYGIKIEKFMPDESALKSMIDRFGEYLFFIDRAKQEYCCYVRKVEPHRHALATLEVWITGLRNDQSEHRKKMKKASIIEEGGRKILKLNPLIEWTIQSVWKYIKEKKLPYNVLFDWDFDSVGCVICSTPLLKGEPPRAGRWRWFNLLKEKDKKECGIHASNE